MQLDGNGQKEYWREIRASGGWRRRLENIARTPVGALYIRQGETERQALERMIHAECHRLHISLTKTQFRRLLELSENA